MPPAYPVAFRRRAIALVQAGNTVAKTAADLGVTDTAIFNWIKQDKISRWMLPGLKTGEARVLARARRRIRELEPAVQLLRRANELLGDMAEAITDPPGDRHPRDRRVHRRAVLLRAGGNDCPL